MTKQKTHFLKIIARFHTFSFTFIKFIVMMTGTAAAKNLAQHSANTGVKDIYCLYLTSQRTIHFLC